MKEQYISSLILVHALISCCSSLEPVGPLQHGALDTCISAPAVTIVIFNNSHPLFTSYHTFHQLRKDGTLMCQDRECRVREPWPLASEASELPYTRPPAPWISLQMGEKGRGRVVHPDHEILVGDPPWLFVRYIDVVLKPAFLSQLSLFTVYMQTSLQWNCSTCRFIITGWVNNFRSRPGHSFQAICYDVFEPASILELRP